MKIITFFNNKGGVGKTTLAVNIAAYLSIEMKKRILFIDGDPQANSTQMIIPEENWWDLYGDESTAITLQAYLKPLEQGDSTIKTQGLDPIRKEDNRFEVDLIPGDPKLSVIEDILSDAWNKCKSGSLEGFRKSNWLRGITEHYNQDYDFIFVDVGPSLGALNRSILLNSDFIITPMGSDIFSLMAVKNIATWMNSWRSLYQNGIDLMEKEAVEFNDFALNLDIDNTSLLIGYSVQQYVTKTFKGGRRPIKSYDAIIKEMPGVISEALVKVIPERLTIDNLNLGDVPYLYSLVPLAQSNNTPIFQLKSADGLGGLQYGQVQKYKETLHGICEKLLKNLGEINDI
ncbi:ParA family protein [Bacillus safensis]